uniref:aspartate-alanine antiporter-like transporter n=1 Tax=Sulfurospirillum cavolei TaxID=366522 RepID=UPI003FA2117D
MINNEIFYLFAIISVGYILGNVKIKGFSLDVTAMLIVALIAGHYGMVISDAFQYFGLAIFIYAVGLQSGPGFFDTIKHEGLKLNLLAALLLVILFVIIFATGHFLHMPKTIIDGIFTGALTSVPALAAALEIKHTPATSVMFGLVYPFGIVATVLFIRLLPVFFRVDLQKEVEAYEAAQKSRFPDILTRNFRITNENFKTTQIKKSQIEAMTSTVIERMSTEKIDSTEDDDILLRYGDVIRVCGTEEQLGNLSIVLGESIGEEHVFDDNMIVLRLLTTSKEIIGKKIGTVKELKSLRAVITKVRRAGIDIAAYPNLTLRLGDKLHVVAPEMYAEKVPKIIANDFLKSPAADFLPKALGDVDGILLGSVPLAL